MLPNGKHRGLIWTRNILAAFLLGVLFALVASFCTGPFDLHGQPSINAHHPGVGIQCWLFSRIRVPDLPDISAQFASNTTRSAEALQDTTKALDNIVLQSSSHDRESKIQGNDNKGPWWRAYATLAQGTAAARRVQRVQRTRSKRVNGTEPGLVVYQGYHNQESALKTWEQSHAHAIYRGFRFAGPPVDPIKGADHLNLEDLLPAVRSHATFETRLGEFSGMLAIANCLEDHASGCAQVHNASHWIGFTSWKERPDPVRMNALFENDMGHNKDTVYFWLEVHEDLYKEAESTHPGIIANTMRTMWEEVYGEPLPALPLFRNRENAYMQGNNFLMSTRNFLEYIKFVRPVLVWLEDNAPGPDCPFNTTKKSEPRSAQQRCWGFVMERAINIWMMHTGKRLVLLNLKKKGTQFIQPVWTQEWGARNIQYQSTAKYAHRPIVKVDIDTVQPEVSTIAKQNNTLSESQGLVKVGGGQDELMRRRSAYVKKIHQTVGAAAAGRKLQKLKPSFFVLGPQKTGTSSLWRFLRRHPALYGLQKERLYFSHDCTQLHCASRPQVEVCNDRGIDKYLQEFPSVGHREAHKLVGDWSATYFTCKCCPSQIRKHFPNASLFVIVRDPAQRSLSRWMEQHEFIRHRALGWKRLLYLNMTLDGYMDVRLNETAACLDNAKGNLSAEVDCAVDDNIFGWSLYDIWIRHWRQHFPEQQIFFLSHRQLLDQPKQVLHQIESRLGIPHHDYANDTLALQHNSNSCSGWPCSPVRSSERYSQGYRIPDSIKRFFASHVAAMQIELANFIDHSDWIVESM
mmetsp:Transcript_17028/g.32593  ORF Transcript_17028/g.32593 Transcript_17028/m.32593 type:complete len:800 (-) Transcript_17028:97-2496(-)